MHRTLIEQVAAEDRPRVERLYQTFVKANPRTAADSIDDFVQHLHAQGLLSDEGLREFHTYRELSLGTLESDRPREAPTPGSRYRLLSLLGEGAMGEVYLGRDHGLGRTVAIKRVHGRLKHDRDLLQRFFNEAQVTAQLDHPSIVPIYGLEIEADGTLAYAMKFVRGKTLSEFIGEAREQLEASGATDRAHSLRARVETFIPVLNALAYAHRRRVIHRDLKPDNIMVARFGEVLVMDWGIARILGPDDAPEQSGSGPLPRPSGDGAVSAARLASSGASDSNPGLTMAGEIIGTPGFMSPEQAKGELLDPASDQYALGLILQELVTLRPAVSGATALALFEKAEAGVREPIAESREPVPRELGAIIAKATAKQKEQRYPSVAAMAEDLQRFLRDESVAADPDRGLRKVKRWVGRNRGYAMAIGVGLVMVMAAVALVILRSGQVAVEAERAAAREREQAMSRLAGVVDARAQRMSDLLHRYESLLEGIAAVAKVVLNEPAPPSGAVAYQYSGGVSDPREPPPYARKSKLYGDRASLLHSDFAAAPGIDRAALRWRLDQLARLVPALQDALMRSGGDTFMDMPLAAAEPLVLERGLPLVWTYLGTVEGLLVGIPGTWLYDDSPGARGYDPRREDWYRTTIDTRGPRWLTSADESGLGLLLNVAETVRDARGTAIAVASVDVNLMRFIDEQLEVAELRAAGAEMILLDAQGQVLVRSSERETLRTMREYDPPPYEERAVVEGMRARPTGLVELGAGRIALWTSLGVGGLTYVVVGGDAALLAAVAPTTAAAVHEP